MGRAVVESDILARVPRAISPVRGEGSTVVETDVIVEPQRRLDKASYTQFAFLPGVEPERLGEMLDLASSGVPVRFQTPGGFTLTINQEGTPDPESNLTLKAVPSENIRFLQPLPPTIPPVEPRHLFPIKSNGKQTEQGDPISNKPAFQGNPFELFQRGAYSDLPVTEEDFGTMISPTRAPQTTLEQGVVHTIRPLGDLL